MMKRPPQILVRGCAYGNLKWQSTPLPGGREVPLFSPNGNKWKTLVRLASTMSSAPSPSSASSSPTNVEFDAPPYPYLPPPTPRTEHSWSWDPSRDPFSSTISRANPSLITGEWLVSPFDPYSMRSDLPVTAEYRSYTFIAIWSRGVDCDTWCDGYMSRGGQVASFDGGCGCGRALCLSRGLVGGEFQARSALCSRVMEMSVMSLVTMEAWKSMHGESEIDRTNSK
jgi:hypothetical protein